MKNYEIYRLTQRENIIIILQGIVITGILGILFFRSFIAVVLLSPMIYFYRNIRRKYIRKERKWKLNLQFKDAVLALSAALEAGYSAENSFEEACSDLKQMYLEEDFIMQELRYIVNQLRMNITVEKALNDFAERTGIEDILSFAQVFATAKRTGGDLIQVIRITSTMISDKIEIKREILTLVSSKRLEANIMKIMPLFLLIYLTFTSPGFLDPLYHNVFGVVLMFVFLMLYLGSTLFIDKIIEIEV